MSVPATRESWLVPARGGLVPSKLGPTALTLLGVGALALGATAAGALAIGAVAIGRMALGELRLGRARAGRAELRVVMVEELTVGRLLIRNPETGGRIPPG